MIRLPNSGFEVQKFELNRQVVSILFDVSVDTGGEGLGNLPRVRRVARPFSLHVAAIANQPGDAVSGSVLWAKDLCQFPGTGTPPDLDLVEAVLRCNVSLGEEKVVDGLGVDVGYAPAVAQDLDLLLQASDRYGPFNLSQTLDGLILEGLSRVFDSPAPVELNYEGECCQPPHVADRIALQDAQPRSTWPNCTRVRFVRIKPTYWIGSSNRDIKLVVIMCVG